MGQIVVNGAQAGRVQQVFRRLYAMRFPIHHMLLGTSYGPPRAGRADGDVTGVVQVPAGGGLAVQQQRHRHGHWSKHAYGEAIDLNPVENPYVGCGMTRDKTALSYLDRSRVRRGMVTPAIVRGRSRRRLGLGRLVDRIDQGLHALLGHRALSSGAQRFRACSV